MKRPGRAPRLGAALALGLLLAAACAGSPATPSATTTAGQPPAASVEAPTGAAPSELPRPTASPTLEPGTTPTLDALGTVVASQQPRIAGTYPSPDERWVAEILIYDCVPVGEEEENAYQELRLTDASTGQQHTADSQFISCGGLGAFGLGGWFWSVNSRFFYYTNASTGVPDGCGYFTSPYLRLDTDDLSVEYLGSGQVSPDGRKLAVWWEGNTEVRQDGWLAIWDVEGELLGIAQLPPPIVLAGPIAWSPESDAVAFLTSESYCPLGLTALGRMQLDMMIPIIILQSQDPSFASLEWELPNRVELTDEQGGRWSYNFATRDLLPSTP